MQSGVACAASYLGCRTFVVTTCRQHGVLGLQRPSKPLSVELGRYVLCVAAPAALVLPMAISRSRQTLPKASSRGQQQRSAVSSTALPTTIDVVSGDPPIFVLDGLCDQRRTARLKQILAEHNLDDLVKTSAYVDDIFEEAHAMQEDDVFRSCVSQSDVQVPFEYQDDPLRSFLWVAGTNLKKLPKDYDQARLGVARRALQTQWNPDDIARSGFKKAASRWRVPEAMLRCLAPLVVQILGTSVEGVVGSEELCTTASSDLSWVLRDSTVVRYKEGESQVPHMDTCDLTMLVYLSDFGGPTCFPNLNRAIPPAAGRVLLFFSTIMEPTRFGGFADAAYGQPNQATMHYGGHPDPNALGEKLVVQLLISAVNKGSAVSWRDTLKGSIFKTRKFTNGEKSVPLQAQFRHQESVHNKNRPFGLALSKQRCAANCRDNGLDLEARPGGPKHCIWCWHHWLEKAAAN